MIYKSLPRYSLGYKFNVEHRPGLPLAFRGSNVGQFLSGFHRRQILGPLRLMKFGSAQPAPFEPVPKLHCVDSQHALGRLRCPFTLVSGFGSGAYSAKLSAGISNGSPLARKASTVRSSRGSGCFFHKDILADLIDCVQRPQPNFFLVGLLFE